MILALALAAALPADANEADLKCVAAIAIALSDASDDKAKPLSYQLSYFLGKIAGRTPGYDLGANLHRASAAYAADVFKGELGRCADEFRAKMMEVDRASKSLGG
ncbi:hypothetical protein [Sphingomonas sp.]|uniref:hypothetical protein n=1 Tax=Sphingomonas sp. TaxID=28214 RepID=UPI001B26108E|nr:hypothetical protein [Sphingomonas sp.]MBO9714741.1 hypothetical protein [Sphingomonas sp.]